MAHPTSGLARHFDASVNADVYTDFIGSQLTGHPVSGEEIEAVDDLVDATLGSGQICLGKTGSSPSAIWRSDGAMRLPSVQVVNGLLFPKSAGGGGVGSFPPSNSAFTVALAFRIDSSGTYPDHANKFQNCGLIGNQRNGFCGVFIGKNGSTFTLYGYNWDGNADVVPIVVTPDQAHVLTFRHEGGNIYLAVDCGAEQSTASGNTTIITGGLRFGDQGNNGTTTADFRGRFGELLVYSVGDSGTALAAGQYLCDKWLGPEIVDETEVPNVPGQDCTVSSGGGQGAGGCVVGFPTIGTQEECVGGGIVPIRADVAHSEVWWGVA